MSARRVDGFAACFGCTRQVAPRSNADTTF
jgi:hypothetical protein